MLFLGAVRGGPEVAGSCFGRLQTKLMNLISDKVGDFEIGSCAAVNVVFHVPGSMLTHIPYEGLRDAKFSRKQKLLMVQVAVPPGIANSEDAETVRNFLLDSLRGASTIASEYFKKKGIEYSEGKYLSFVDSVASAFRDGC